MSSDQLSILCIIPARGGSKRFPKKNVALFHGIPLVGLAAKVAKESGVFDAICISSDDEDILRLGQEYGADETHKRLPEFASDRVQLGEACENILDDFASRGRQFDAFAILTPMNPLRTADDVRAATDLFLTSDADAVISVAQFPHSPQRALAIREEQVHWYFPNEEHERYTAEEPLYFHDATIVLVRTAQFRRTGKLYDGKVVPYRTPLGRSVNIDYKSDLELAEFLYQRSQQ